MGLSILEFVIALGILITLHEFGHFIVSKMFGIEVEEFGLGFPPRIVRLFKWRETDFTLNWIPFGAFVRPKGENDPNVPGGMAAANPWKRLAVLLGGPVTNLLVGAILFSIIFTQTGAPDLSKVIITEVADQSPAQAAGLKANDVVLKIDGIDITSREQLQSTIQKFLGQEVTITVNRNGKVIETKATPRKNPPQGQGALGIGINNPVTHMSWIQAIPAGAKAVWSQIYQLATLPSQLAKGTVTSEQARPVGPVGMFDMYNSVRQQDIQNAEAAPNNFSYAIINRLLLLAMISVALGITNLLPIPALDGGRILFVLPEILFRRRIPPQYENAVHLIGFAALLILMVYITTQDIINPVKFP